MNNPNASRLEIPSTTRPSLVTGGKTPLPPLSRGLRMVDSRPATPMLTTAAPASRTDAPAERRPFVTGREKQILRLLCDGMTNNQIATSLEISRETVKAQLKRIFRKIAVKNRTQAAVLVTRQHLA